MQDNAAENFLKSLTRTTPETSMSKRKVVASVAALVEQQIDPSATLMSALSCYSHSATRRGTEPVVLTADNLVQDAVSLTLRDNGIDHLRFGKVLQGFRSLGEYLAHLPNIPGNTNIHIKTVANATHQRFQEINSRETMFGFKDAQHLDSFGRYLQQRGAFVISESEILFGDELGRPQAILSLNQNNNARKPLDPFSFELICGNEDLFQELTSILDTNLEIRSSVARLHTITGVGPGGLEITEEDINPETTKMAGNCFYPWMKNTSVEEYFREFLESDANVMVLYGPPGTGKSSMLTTAIAKLGLSALITSNSAVASNPEFLSRLGQKLAGENGKYDMVIVEDADSLMAPRDQGNDALSQLLNATSGISQKLRFKLVLTSNQKDDSKIDPALLRHGRCFDRMLFGGLNQEQANEVMEFLGRPPVKVAAGARVTLAQVINSDVGGKLSSQDESVTIVAQRFPLV